jgi:hypothetical protein
MVYVIVNKKGKRVKHSDGSLTPAMKYPAQAWNYLYKNFGDTLAFNVIRVGDSLKGKKKNYKRYNDADEPYLKAKR